MTKPCSPLQSQLPSITVEGSLLSASQTQQTCSFSEIWASYSFTQDALLIGLSHYNPHENVN